jgi:mono/diheme cytochrome c family protein
MHCEYARWLALGIWTLALGSACARSAPERVEPGAISHAVNPTAIVPASPDLIALGRATYDKECIACHGPAGDGLGAAAYLLFPRPRDSQRANSD